MPQVLQEMHDTLFHHFMFAPQCETMSYRKRVDKPVEQATESPAKISIVTPEFFELFHIYIVTC